MNALPPVMRPDGRLYRPRKLLAVMTADDGEFSGVLVFGTHDIHLAQPLADQLVMHECGSTFRAALPVTGWWRDSYMFPGERGWVPDVIAGRAAVSFQSITEITTEVPCG